MTRLIITPATTKVMLEYPAREGETFEQHVNRANEIIRVSEMFGGDDDYDDSMGNPVRNRFYDLTDTVLVELDYDPEDLF